MFIVRKKCYQCLLDVKISGVLVLYAWVLTGQVFVGSDGLGSSFLVKGLSKNEGLRCRSDNYNVTCCNANEFQCDGGSCVPMDSVCSSNQSRIKMASLTDRRLFFECPDGSDEFGCSFKPCLSRSSKCFGSCIDLAGNRSKCSCNKGYILETSSFDQRCVDIDECAIGFDRCSQGCVNLKGSFACNCEQGFDSDPNGFPGNCKTKDRKILVLYDSYPWIYGSYLDSSDLPQEMVPSGRVDRLDLDPVADIIYWTNRHRLLRSYLPGVEGKKVTMGHPQVVPIPKGTRRVFTKGTFFSFDWAGRNIYWLTLNGRDRENRAVTVTKLDGRYKKLLMNGVWHATNLLVHPDKGVMYWTWLRTKDDSGISTAWMNGRYRKTLLRLKGQEPVALTIDRLSTGRIYWMDATTDTVYFAVHVATLGRSQSVVSTSRHFKVVKIEHARSPQPMLIFENDLYWLNNDNNKLLRRDKFGRGRTEVVKDNLSNTSFVRIHHRSMIDRDKFMKDSCSHLTLIHPEGFECACPDEMETTELPGEHPCLPTERPLLEPLRCDCTDRNMVCNPATPFSACYCFDVCVNYTLVEEKTVHLPHASVYPDARVVISIIPLVLVLFIVGVFIFITYPLNSGIPLEPDSSSSSQTFVSYHSGTEPDIVIRT